MTRDMTAAKPGAARHDAALQKSHLWLYLCFLGCLMYWELVCRPATNLPFWNEGLMFALLFAASLAGMFTALCSLFPPRGGFVVAVVLLSAACAVYIVQMFYYSIFNTYLSAFSILNGGQALQFGETILGQLGRVWPWVLCMLLPLPLFLLFGRRLPRPASGRAAVVALLVCLLFQYGAAALLPAFGTGLFTPRDYYTSDQSLGPTANKLGLYTTLRQDAARLAFGGGTPEATSSAAGSDLAAAALVAAGVATQQRDLFANVLDIDLAALALGEEDAAIAELHSYFSGVPPTWQNEYTGMFEGYNLITVTAESFAPYAVDEKRTPTLYKMMNEGINFENFHTPLWDNSTLDGEYAICQSQIPKQGVWSMWTTGKEGHALPFTLGNQFSAQGYGTYAYHNHSAEYYERVESHPNMGYDFKALDFGLELESALEWPESDLELVDVTTEEFIADGKTPFHVYYLTVSGHQPYENYNAMSAKNWSSVKNLDLSTQAKAYLACNVELDAALELLWERLEEAGIAENTVVALTSDHPPYPLQLEGISELLGHEVDYSFEYYENSFFLYSPGMEAVTVDKPCSSLDVLPTLSNLFALPYDSRLLMGRDVLSYAQPLVILANRSWITDKARFCARTGVLESLDAKDPVSDAYAQRIHEEVARRFDVSAKVLETNYYASLPLP